MECFTKLGLCSPTETKSTQQSGSFVCNTEYSFKMLLTLGGICRRVLYCWNAVSKQLFGRGGRPCRSTFPVKVFTLSRSWPNRKLEAADELWHEDCSWDAYFCAELCPLRGGPWGSLAGLLISTATAAQNQWTRFNPACTLVKRTPPNRWCSVIQHWFSRRSHKVLYTGKARKSQNSLSCSQGSRVHRIKMQFPRLK